MGFNTPPSSLTGSIDDLDRRGVDDDNSDDRYSSRSQGTIRSNGQDSRHSNMSDNGEYNRLEEESEHNQQVQRSMHRNDQRESLMEDLSKLRQEHKQRKMSLHKLRIKARMGKKHSPEEQLEITRYIGHCSARNCIGLPVKDDDGTIHCSVPDHNDQEWEDGLLQQDAQRIEDILEAISQLSEEDRDDKTEVARSIVEEIHGRAQEWHKFKFTEDARINNEEAQKASEERFLQQQQALNERKAVLAEQIEERKQQILALRENELQRAQEELARQTSNLDEKEAEQSQMEEGRNNISAEEKALAEDRKQRKEEEEHKNKSQQQKETNKLVPFLLDIVKKMAKNLLGEDGLTPNYHENVSVLEKQTATVERLDKEGKSANKLMENLRAVQKHYQLTEGAQEQLYEDYIDTEPPVNEDDRVKAELGVTSIRAGKTLNELSAVKKSLADQDEIRRLKEALAKAQSSGVGRRLASDCEPLRRRLPENYDTMSPSEQTLARFHLTRDERPKSHIVVLEQLLRDIMNSA